MSKTEVRYTCDGCGKDITYTTNAVDYRLELRVVNKAVAHRVGEATAVTLMHVNPAISDERHFCNSLNCIRAWLEKIASPSP